MGRKRAARNGIAQPLALHVEQVVLDTPHDITPCLAARRQSIASSGADPSLGPSEARRVPRTDHDLHARREESRPGEIVELFERGPGGAKSMRQTSPCSWSATHTAP